MIWMGRIAASALALTAVWFSGDTVDSSVAGGHGERQVVPLEEEIGFISRYLEIQKLRFGDRLKTRLEVDEAALSIVVPTLILQPLVENALEHGVARRGEGRIRLTTAVKGERLLLRLEDDGPGLGGSEVSLGVGLENTRARLERHHGGDFALDLREGPAGGAVAEIGLPLSGAEPVG